MIALPAANVGAVYPQQQVSTVIVPQQQAAVAQTRGGCTCSVPANASTHVKVVRLTVVPSKQKIKNRVTRGSRCIASFVNASVHHGVVSCSVHHGGRRQIKLIMVCGGGYLRCSPVSPVCRIPLFPRGCFLFGSHDESALRAGCFRGNREPRWTTSA